MELSVTALKALVKHAPTIVVVVDEDHKIVYVNQTIPMFSSETVIGRNQLDFVMDEDRERVERACAEARQTGEPQQLVTHGAGPNGSPATYSTKVVRLPGDESPPLLAMYTTDISKRVEEQQALQDSDAYSKRLMQNIPGMIYRGNPDWSVAIMQGCEELCGYTPNEVSAMDGAWTAVIHPEDRDAVFAEGSALVAAPRSLVQQYRIVAKSGQVRWVEDRKTSSFVDGEFEGVDGILFDITQRKLAEERLRQTQDQVIAQQRQAIRELTTPVIQVWDDILVLPIVGTLDTVRAAQMIEELLSTINAKQARVVIVDITGVSIVDTRVAAGLMEMVRSASMLGAECVITGVNPAVAQTLVRTGVTFADVLTKGNLQAGLRFAFEVTGKRVGSSPERGRASSLH